MPSVPFGTSGRTFVSGGHFYIMKKIIVNSPKYGIKEILVDDEDFEFLNQWRWNVSKDYNTFYARRSVYEKGKYKNLIMHRLLLGLTDPKIFADHEDHNGLNNQRNNIRVATHSQNQKNISSRKGSTSKYLGVHLHKSTTKYFSKTKQEYVFYHTEWWIAQIVPEKHAEDIILGRFKSEIDAAKCYNEGAKKYHGKFANLNIIEENAIDNILPSRVVSSKYRGVRFMPKLKRWRAEIRHKNVTKFIGEFYIETEAALAYNKSATEILGDKARLNIITENL